MLPGVCHRGGAADKDRVAAVEAADPDQTPEHVRQVGPEDAPIHMELVDDDVLEIREELLPFRVVGQDPGVEHVGIRDDDVALPADRLPGVVGGVPVVGVGLDVGLHLADQAVDLVHLVLGEGLRREHIEGAGLRLFEDLLEDREVVAEGLAARRRGDENDALALSDQIHGLCLVAVKLTDAALREDLPEGGMDPLRVLRKFAGTGGDLPDRPDVLHEPPVLFGPREPLLQSQLRHGGTLPFFGAIIKSIAVRGPSEIEFPHLPRGVIPVAYRLRRTAHDSCKDPATHPSCECETRWLTVIYPSPSSMSMVMELQEGSIFFQAVDAEVLEEVDKGLPLEGVIRKTEQMARAVAVG